MTGALNFYAKDVYGEGFADTRSQTVPEENDQMALVDDQELAEKNPAKHDPAISRGIIIGLIIMLAIIFIFSM